VNEASQTILLVEDEDQIRKFLRISLEAHGYTVVEERLAGAALETLSSLDPDLVILDLGLPDMDGQKFIERAREWSQVPIIVLSVRSREFDKVAALDAGANDYVTKPFGISELMARVRAVLRATVGHEREQSTFQAGNLSVDLASREVRVSGRSVHLSRKEYSLLALFLSHPSQVLTHQQILREVWSPRQENQTHYLRVLVGQLRQKLGDDPANPMYIATEQGVGYRFQVPVE
jgi:two-component system, OmpR family, KDP operon response regulator KdpE